MRESVDRPIRDDPVLVELLSLAACQAERLLISDVRQKAIIRFVYVSLACSRDFVLEHGNYIMYIRPILREWALEKTHALASASEHAHNCERTFAYDLRSALTVSIDLALAHVIDRRVDRKLARSLAHDLQYSLDLNYEIGQELADNLHPEIGVDIRLLRAWQGASVFGLIWKDNRIRLSEMMDAYAASFFPKMINFVHTTIDAPKLLKRLELLDVPSASSSAWQWQTFTLTLQDLLTAERAFDFGRSISREQLRKMDDYFVANEQLISSLGSVPAGAQEQIWQELLLPPSDDG